MYLTLSSLPLAERQKHSNHHLISFVEDEAAFGEALEPCMQEIELLHQGVVMPVNGQETFVLGTLAAHLGDLPHQNMVVSVMNYNADVGCR